jgi:hypothetical protein
MSHFSNRGWARFLSLEITSLTNKENVEFGALSINSGLLDATTREATRARLNEGAI